MSAEARKKIQMGETAATITCKEEFVSAVIGGIAKARAEVVAYAKDRPEFLLSLEPLAAEENAPETIRRMCSAAEEAGVGPMATVAGAIAEAGAEAARDAGATHCIVDNGGDIALLLDHPAVVGILDQLESDLLPAIEVPPTDGRIIGLCTSSGIFGHSISFGRAEAATVMARTAPLADALATALGNGCKGGSDIRKALESISGTDGVLWAMAIVDGRVGTMGDMPRLFQAKRNGEDVTVHSDFPGSIPVNDD
ncbi:MAG TPA: UPF0280 family protein [Thermoplasmata archaeon]|nr:UPF0280 family protein [Thermoplasmata archaeon]